MALRDRPPDYDRGFRLLSDAARTAPDNAVIQSDLGQLYLNVRQEILDGQRATVGAAAAAGIPACWSSAAAGNPFAALASVSAWPGVREPATAAKQTLEPYVVPALRHLAEARALCPLLPLPHLRFAALATELFRADPPAVYLDRGRRLVPHDPDLWFIAGAQQIRDGQPAQARASWRRSLELSDRHFDEIMARVIAGRTGPFAEAIEGVLPDDPGLLVRAAEWLDRTDDRPLHEHSASGPARALLERGLALLAPRPEPRPAEEYHLQARCRWLLGQDDAALAAYDRALLAAPNRQDWRLEYARLLVEQERWDRADDELKRLLDRTGDAEASEMLKRVQRERLIDHGPPERDRPDGGRARTARPGPKSSPAVALPAGRFAAIDPHFPRSVQLAALAATVRVMHPESRQRGSGVVVARANNFVYILTAAHLVPEGPPGDEVEVQFFSAADWPKPLGEVRRAVVKVRARDVDLAVLWLVAPDATSVLPVCPPTATRGQRLPMTVLTVGCDRSAPTAIVDRARMVKFIEVPYHANFYETDVAQAPGRSGGPLVDGRGYVIGVCSGTRGGKGYYVSTSEIHDVLRKNGLDWIAKGMTAGAN